MTVKDFAITIFLAAMTFWLAIDCPITIKSNDTEISKLQHDIKAHEQQLQLTHEMMLQFNEELTRKIDILNGEIFPPVAMKYPDELNEIKDIKAK